MFQPRLKIVSRFKDLWSGENIRFSSLKILFFYIFFIEAVALLAFQGLSYNCFWDDEAETAMIAKNLVTLGKLTGWNGRHLCTNRNGNLLDGNFRPTHPIAMYLATALSFKLFGCTTAAGRLPFVIFGLQALILLFWMLRATYPSLPALARYSVALTALSTSYLLYIRQCRYYSLCIFFALLALAFYRQSLRKPKWVMFAGLGVSLTALFFSHYLIMICFTLALLASHLVFHVRKWGKKDYIRGTLTCALLLAPIVWFSVHSKVWIRPDTYAYSGTALQILKRLYLNFRDFDTFGVLPAIVALGGVAAALRFRNKFFEMKLFLEFGFFITAYIVILAFLSPQLVKGKWLGNLADIRYMVVLIPMGAVCTGALLSIIHTNSKLFAFLIFFAITCTNVFSLHFINPKIRPLLPDYVYEITHDYITPYEAVINFLNEHPQFKSDTIVCTPEYCQVPLQFYCGDYLRMGGLLDTNTSLPISKVRALPAPLFKDTYSPTLIIAFGWTEAHAELVSSFARGGFQYVGGPKLSLPIHHMDMTRPELPWHSFSKIKNADADAGDVIYFFRRTTSPTK